jgi:hypothetical protein
MILFVGKVLSRCIEFKLNCDLSMRRDLFKKKKKKKIMTNLFLSAFAVTSPNFTHQSS